MKISTQKEVIERIKNELTHYGIDECAATERAKNLTAALDDPETTLGELQQMLTPIPDVHGGIPDFRLRTHAITTIQHLFHIVRFEEDDHG